MSSPYNPETKKGTEETLEAIAQTRQWASRIDTTNDASGVDVDSFMDELREEEERLREEYRVKNTELAIDNFVFNHEETVVTILTGDLDEKVSSLSELSSYINDEFGRESPISLSKEELMWLVAQEVKYHLGRNNRGLYSEEQFSGVDLDSVGKCPEVWGEKYPLYNR